MAGPELQEPHALCPQAGGCPGGPEGGALSSRAAAQAAGHLLSGRVGGSDKRALGLHLRSCSDIALTACFWLTFRNCWLTGMETNWQYLLVLRIVCHK